MNPDRRTLQFENLDAILPDVERLMAGYSSVGHWTLGQVCEHLATVNRLLVDTPAEPKPDPSLRVSDEQKRQVFATGLLPENMPMPGKLTPPTPIDDATGADQLRASIGHYRKSTTGPVMDHRLFGPLSKAEWDRVVCIHSAHHLCFLIPQAG